MKDSTTAVTQDVLTLLNRLDPYGFEPGAPGGAPEDEYALEAQPMATVLMRDGRINIEQVDAIWLEWFDQKLSALVGPHVVDAFVVDLIRLVDA